MTHRVPTAKPFDRVGRLIVIMPGRLGGGKRSALAYLCKCDCGNVAVVRKSNWGKSKSCGCLNKERLALANRTHGLSKTPEYEVWGSMIGRCERPSTPSFPDYGGRGIRVCNRWRRDFQAFYEDMGPRPSARHTLERLDCDGHYEPSNCIWLLAEKQNANRRTSRRIAFKGRTQCLAEWAREIGIGKDTLRRRLEAGWSAEKALTTPLQKQRRKGLLLAT